jgi:hypothetical protein
MENAQQIRIGIPACAEIDDEPRLPQLEREVHAPHDPDGATLRTTDEHRGAGLGAGLANLDHRWEVPAVPSVETAQRR